MAHHRPIARIIVTYPFPLGEPNGGARSAREICIHLGKTGVDVILVTVSAAPATRYPRPRPAHQTLGLHLDAELSQAGVRVVRVQQHRIFQRGDGLGVRRALGRILRTFEVDAVLGYYHEAAFLPTLLRRRGVTFGFISTWQSYKMALSASGITSWFDDRFVAEAHRQANILFATSNFTRAELIEAVGVQDERITQCPFGVDRHFLSIPSTRSAPPWRFIFFGRLVRSKGIGDAIEALARLAQTGTRNWTFHVMGDGNRAWVEDLATQHGIADRVVIRGPAEDDALAAELAEADLAILPSHVEAFGLSIAEAQAAGLPVVAYDSGSVPEIVQDGTTGWLAPCRDVDSLLASIQEAVSDPDEVRRRGQAGRERVATTFTWDRTAETILHGLEMARHRLTERPC